MMMQYRWLRWISRQHWILLLLVRIMQIVVFPSCTHVLSLVPVRTECSLVEEPPSKSIMNGDDSDLFFSPNKRQRVEEVPPTFQEEDSSLLEEVDNLSRILQSMVEM
mmetsp:Transcript_7622/g.17505  ORF Transcript_7622/g.17505 Transcript_7622/m.17505 type:complete len:107 (+) Transcript_7622:993-1313(+)